MKSRASFRTKLLLLTLVPIGVAQLVTLFAVMQTVEKDVQLRARDSLNTGATVVAEFFAARAEQLRTSVNVLAADYGLKEAVATGDDRTIRSVLENHGRRVGAEILAILDIDGNPVVSTLELGTSQIVDPNLFSNDSPRRPRETAVIVADAAYQVFTVPLRAPVTIGWVVAGFPVDEDLASRIRELTGLDTSFVRADTLATTLVSTHDVDSVGFKLHATNDVVFMTNEGGEEALTIQTTMISGDQSILVVLQRSLREAMLPYVEARRGLIAFAAALLLLVAIAGAWLSTSIAEPIKTLAAAARRVISGNYDTCIAVTSNDEFEVTAIHVS